MKSIYLEISEVLRGTQCARALLVQEVARSRGPGCSRKRRRRRESTVLYSMPLTVNPSLSSRAWHRIVRLIRKYKKRLSY
jgi:hypothetical protein